MSSCNTLDVDPTTSIEGTDAVVDSISVERSMIGIYSGIQSGNYYGLRYMFYQDTYTDLLAHSGTFTTDQEISNRALNPTNLQIANTWATMYDIINRANTLIKRIETVPLTTTTKNRYIAEARFIRALVYFDLVKVFGGVPLHLDPTRFIEEIKNLPRSTESEVYNQVIQDLQFAEANLSSNAGALGATGFGSRPNRAASLAASALLARVYLQRGDNANAFLKADQVIVSGQYASGTMIPFPDIFTREKTNEAIFELDFTLNDQNGLAVASDPTTGGQKFYYRTAFYNSFVASAGAGDARFAASARRIGTRNSVVKYFRLASGDDNVPILRIAEMFLIRAEATARQGVATDAPVAQVINDINKIRNRAGLANANPTTNSAALTEILTQRGFEFAAEGHRFADLKRYGILGVVIPALGGTNDFRALWPIPFQQLTNNPTLTQNTGY
ncbi:MAG: RagB/SusD family nutrient uptake outer membrane protein [Microscillaceae bacterium]|nr:RagB/SusD family nutrient uptake outer membrane protein [Microscillaceae bacterium]